MGIKELTREDIKEINAKCKLEEMRKREQENWTSLCFLQGVSGLLDDVLCEIVTGERELELGEIKNKIWSSIFSVRQIALAAKTIQENQSVIDFYVYEQTKFSLDK